MIKKNIILAILYLFLISNFAFGEDYSEYIQDSQTEEYAEEQIDIVRHNTKKKKKKRKKKKKARKNKKGFFRTYILPNENQIFGKKKHLISLFGGYDYSKFEHDAGWIATKQYGDLKLYNGYSLQMRKNTQIALNYSRPNKFWEINGRFSIGIFTWLMKQNIDTIYDMDFNTWAQGWLYNYTIGFEAIQEAIFGHKNLYFTLGFGVSYQIVIHSSIEIDKDYYKRMWNYYKPKILWNNSNFNWVIKASIGHRFDCGLILEVNWKHYSNGNLGSYNWGLNFFGGTIGYVF